MQFLTRAASARWCVDNGFELDGGEFGFACFRDDSEHAAFARKLGAFNSP